MFNSNVKGLLSRAKALPLLQGGGSIIFDRCDLPRSKRHLRSVFVLRDKAAIRSFARSWTLHLQARQIRVNAVSPGPTDTLFLNHLGQMSNRRCSS